MKKQNEGIEKIGNRSETAKAKNKGFMASKPSVSLKYPECIRLETKCMLKRTDQGHWDDICYYKTARVPNQEQRSKLDIPTKTVEEGKEYTYPASHQCDFGESNAPNLEAANRKEKQKIEHFGVKLEEEEEYHDRRHFHPIQPNKNEESTLNKGIKIKTEDASSTSSEDLVIV
nr:hypothetical protein [Tanacetum cinerariifolium]